MKIRTSFVSNSSSSSFIIHAKDCKPGKDFKEFLEKLTIISDKDINDGEPSWFGNEACRDENFEVQGNFIQIGSWRASEEMYDLVKEYFGDASFDLDY